MVESQPFEVVNLISDDGHNDVAPGYQLHGEDEATKLSSNDLSRNNSEAVNNVMVNLNKQKSQEINLSLTK